MHSIRLGTPKTLLILSACLTLSSCVSMPPKWDGKLWAGDSAKAGITRTQENQTIQCQAPAMDGYICMSYEDMNSFYKTFVLGCKVWRKDMPKMTFEQALTLMEEAHVTPSH